MHMYVVRYINHQTRFTIPVEVEYHDTIFSITTMADERCDALLENARVVAEKFRTAFSSCHSVYSSRHYLSDDHLENLACIQRYFRQFYLYLCMCNLHCF